MNQCKLCSANLHKFGSIKRGVCEDCVTRRRMEAENEMYQLGEDHALSGLDTPAYVNSMQYARGFERGTELRIARNKQKLSKMLSVLEDLKREVGEDVVAQLLG